MLTPQSNEGSRVRDLKLKTKGKEKKQRKRKIQNEEIPLKKKAKLEWKPEDCAHTYGRWSKFSGEGVHKKFHYETFEFHGIEYGLEDSVLLAPEKKNQRPYIAIIKDIYRQGKKENVKLEVQWFYRPEDIENGNWESKDDLFYSFHRDEVDAEAVMQKCHVYFVQGNKELPECRPSPDFIVKKVYDHEKKKLKKLSHRGFNMQQKDEIDLLVAKTISRVHDLPDIEKLQMAKISRHKRSIPKNYISKAEGTIPESSTRVSLLYDESTWTNFEIGGASRTLPSASIWKNFEIGGASRTVSSEIDRDKILEQLLEAIKDTCHTSEEKQDGDCDFVWPNDVVPVVQALEHALYDSFVEDIPNYNNKVKILVDKLKNSQVFSRRLLTGEIKPEQAIHMTRYELTRGFTFEEINAGFEEPTWQESVASTNLSWTQRFFRRLKKIFYL